MSEAVEALEPVHSAERYEVFIYVDRYRDRYPKIPQIFWTLPGHFGGGTRRKKFRPECISVTWHRHNEGDWRIGWLNVTGPYLHANSAAMIGRLLVGATTKAETNEEIPGWVRQLLDLFEPGQGRP
jgi:hypothetical protein